MRRLILGSLAALLAGCAITPKPILEQATYEPAHVVEFKVKASETLAKPLSLSAARAAAQKSAIEECGTEQVTLLRHRRSRSRDDVPFGDGSVSIRRGFYHFTFACNSD